MTMSSRRPGIASPALAVLAALALRRALFCFRARAFLPDIALEEWVLLCARRGFREKRYFNKRPDFFEKGERKV
jgi:hypothetical protein